MAKTPKMSILNLLKIIRACPGNQQLWPFIASSFRVTEDDRLSETDLPGPPSFF